MKSGVAYLGPDGTFSHFVARRRFGEARCRFPAPSVPEVVERVLADDSTIGLVPVENSSGGPIYDTIDLLIQNRDRLHIHEEIELDVRLALVGHRDREVRRVVSHFVPLQHNRDFLRAEYPKAETHAVASTAAAIAEAVADPHCAALASPTSATAAGLTLLKFPIPPNIPNVTHFLVLGQRPPRPSRHTGRWKTALVFTLENRCGSLHHFLGPFARKQVNITRIISRPVHGQPETAIFFLELEGRGDQAPIAAALRLCRRHAESLHRFESYPAGRKFRS